MKPYRHFQTAMRPADLTIQEEHRDAIDHTLLVSIGLTPDQAHQWIAKTSALRKSCGCKTGAGFMVATLALYPLSWYWVLSESLQSVWLAIAVGLVAAFVAGGVGKLTGLLVAHLRVRVRVRNIRIRKDSQNG